MKLLNFFAFFKLFAVVLLMLSPIDARQQPDPSVTSVIDLILENRKAKSTGSAPLLKADISDSQQQATPPSADAPPLPPRDAPPLPPRDAPPLPPRDTPAIPVAPPAPPVTSGSSSADAPPVPKAPPAPQTTKQKGSLAGIKADELKKQAEKMGAGSMGEGSEQESAADEVKQDQNLTIETPVKGRVIRIQGDDVLITLEKNRIGVGGKNVSQVTVSKREKVTPEVKGEAATFMVNDFVTLGAEHFFGKQKDMYSPGAPIRVRRDATATPAPGAVTKPTADQLKQAKEKLGSKAKPSEDQSSQLTEGILKKQRTFWIIEVTEKGKKLEYRVPTKITAGQDLNEDKSLKFDLSALNKKRSKDDQLELDDIIFKNAKVRAKLIQGQQGQFDGTVDTKKPIIILKEGS